MPKQKVDCRQCGHFRPAGEKYYTCAIGVFGVPCSRKGIYGLYIGCSQFESVQPKQLSLFGGEYA